MKFVAVLLVTIAVFAYADDAEAPAPTAAPAEVVSGAVEGGEGVVTKNVAEVSGSADGASQAPVEAVTGSTVSAGPASPSAAPSVESTTKGSAHFAPLSSALLVFGYFLAR
ncbi:unnamed protein product [Caenorhabditis sp. 36 PRJEB53466]|nr:unnamed protein product [Caenorhabditis sp. 36 PRJEB53466]